MTVLHHPHTHTLLFYITWCRDTTEQHSQRSVPSKHAGSSSEAFWFWPLLSVCSQNWARSYMPDLTSCIGSILSKKDQIIILLCKNRSGFDLECLPGQVLAKCIWSGSKLMCKNPWARFWQNTTGPLPFFHFQTRLHSSIYSSEHSVQNQAGSDLVLADCQVLAKRIRSGSKPMCKNRQARLWPKPMWIGCKSDLACLAGEYR